MAASTPTSATTPTEALRELAAFPLVEALFGRRSRRFALGDEIPDGPLAYRSRHEPVPLTDLERMLVLSAMGGTTGWHYSITRHARYAPHYAGGAAGRTFPSAGFHTAELFFTDDSGLYFFPTRDAGALVDPATDQVTPELMVERHRDRLRKLADRYRLTAFDNRGAGRTAMPGGSVSAEMMADDAAQVLRAYLDALLDHDTTDRLPAITAPTLVLAGGRDSTARPELCRAVAELIPGARFEVMEQEAHQPFPEVPDGWNARVDAFWRQLEAGD